MVFVLLHFSIVTPFVYPITPKIPPEQVVVVSMSPLFVQFDIFMFAFALSVAVLSHTTPMIPPPDVPALFTFPLFVQLFSYFFQLE